MGSGFEFLELVCLFVLLKKVKSAKDEMMEKFAIKCCSVVFSKELIKVI